MNKMRLGLAAGVAVALIQACCAAARPVPNPVLLERLQKGPEIIGIVHWGLNTFTDQEWGFGDSNPALLAPAKFDADQIRDILGQLDSGKYGMILRAKGIVACADGGWIHFDYVPEEHNIRMGSASIIGKLCVIGAQLDEQGVAKLFGV
jgi:hypothetical protein